MSVHHANDAAIAKALVEAAIAKGYMISVWEGGDWAIRRSKDANAILEVLNSTDEDTLVIRDAKGEMIGKVFLVYGNGGNDLIADYTSGVWLQELVEPVISAFQ